MAHTITVDAKTLEHVVTQLNKLAKDMAAIKKQLLEQDPPYGSDAWWKKEIKEGRDDMQKGAYIEFKSAKDMVNHLKKL